MIALRDHVSFEQNKLRSIVDSINRKLDQVVVQMPLRLPHSILGIQLSHIVDKQCFMS